jgi:hypothetical protein
MAQTHEVAMKALAAKAGVSLGELHGHHAADEKWCYACDAWKARTEFRIDRSRWDGLVVLCADCRNTSSRSYYKPKGKPLWNGNKPDVPRDGDKRQARKRVNQMVICGRLPRPNDMPCFDCRHQYQGSGDKRHEYDHYLGYDAQHHLAVQAVCSTCHHRRAAERGELKGSRRAA